MKVKAAKKGGQWVLWAWLFLFLLMFLLWFAYYDWDSNNSYEHNDKEISTHELPAQPYEPAKNRPIAVGEAFIISNNTIILAPNTGYMEIEQYEGNELSPLLIVDVFPEKHNGGKQ